MICFPLATTMFFADNDVPLKWFPEPYRVTRNVTMRQENVCSPRLETKPFIHEIASSLRLKRRCSLVRENSCIKLKTHTIHLESIT